MESNEALKERLEQLRAAVLAKDQSIVKELNDRMKICQDIGATKQKLLVDAKQEASGQTGTDVYKPTQEKKVFARIARLNQANQGALSDVAAQAIYREVMSASIALQQPTNVAYLGPPSSFCQQAAKTRFGASVAYTAADNIEGVFEAVRNRSATYGVVPIENSFSGRHAATMDLLVHYDDSLVIFAEIHIPIRYCLCVNPKQDKGTKGWTTLFTEPYAIQLCSTYVQQNLPDIRVITALSSSKAAQLCAETPGSAVICNRDAAERLNLDIVSCKIGNSFFHTGEKESISRYYVLGREVDRKSGSDKTLVIFSLKDRTGSLVEALSVFKHCNINIDKIESRPARDKNTRTFDYVFFVDLDGHAEDENMKRAIFFLTQACTMVRVIGSCPKPFDLQPTRQSLAKL